MHNNSRVSKYMHVECSREPNNKNMIAAEQGESFGVIVVHKKVRSAGGEAKK